MAQVMSLPVLFTTTLTGSAQQLTADPVQSSITITAINASTDVTLISANPTPTSSNSASLANGQSVTLSIGSGNTDQIYVSGTSGDKVSVAGV
jgi:hypothetical protein